MKRIHYQRGARAEWDDRTAALEVAELETVPFQEVLSAFLPKDPSLTCLEIGALPGRFLVFFHKNRGYRVIGLDFGANQTVFHEMMRVNGIRDYEYIDVDFREFQARRQFDIVASFGFVEHFDEFDSIIEKHCELVANSGYVVIGMPNFRYVQHLYHWIFDRDNLRIHNIKAMDGDRVDAALIRHGFERKYAGFLGGLELWRESHIANPAIAAMDRAIRGLANALGRYLPDSRFYSAFQLFIYQRHTTRSGRRKPGRAAAA